MLLFRPVVRECNVPTHFNTKIYLLPQNDSKWTLNWDFVVGDVQKVYCYMQVQKSSLLESNITPHPSPPKKKKKRIKIKKKKKKIDSNDYLQ